MCKFLGRASKKVAKRRERAFSASMYPFALRLPHPPSWNADIAAGDAAALSQSWKKCQETSGALSWQSWAAKSTSTQYLRISHHTSKMNFYCVLRSCYLSCQLSAAELKAVTDHYRDNIVQWYRERYIVQGVWGSDSHGAPPLLQLCVTCISGVICKGVSYQGCSQVWARPCLQNRWFIQKVILGSQGEVVRQGRREDQ